MIYLASLKNADLLGRSLKGGSPGGDEKAPWAEVLPGIPPEQPEPPEPENPKPRKKRSASGPKPDDRVYLDISGLSRKDMKRAFAALKKRGDFWGVIDPEGEAEDPAAFFFEGASDYIGPALVKKGLKKKRFEEAFAAKRGRVFDGAGPDAAQGAGTAKKSARQKIPAGKFRGWESVHSGTPAPFLFLYARLAGKSSILSLAGEAAFDAAKLRLREALLQNLRDADALLWIETEDSFLFLLPALAPNGKAAVGAVLKMLANSRLIGIEKLGLSLPAEFVFALHYGSAVFRSPGETGALVSEPVNYIFHLGTRKAETGRLTVSGAVGEKTIPRGLADLFSPAGLFEGIPIRHSRRFAF